MNGPSLWGVPGWAHMLVHPMLRTHQRPVARVPRRKAPRSQHGVSSVPFAFLSDRDSFSSCVFPLTIYLLLWHTKHSRNDRKGQARAVLVFEYKVQGYTAQYAVIDDAICVLQFIRNKCVRLWMETRGTTRNDLQCDCAILAQDFPFASRLNSQARQVAAERAWDLVWGTGNAISRFYKNCANRKPGKKGYPRFQHATRSVEYKQTSWKLQADGKHLTFTDGCGIGRVRLIGNQHQRIEEFPPRQIKRADGYYVQFAVDASRQVKHIPTGAQAGIDMGLKEFLTDSAGNTVANPRHLRKAEQRLKKLHRRLSRKQKGSANRRHARQALAKGYLKVQRQREDFARKTASTLITSHDLIAYEHLQIANLVKNRKLAKSISDASWGSFSGGSPTTDRCIASLS